MNYDLFSRTMQSLGFREVAKRAEAVWIDQSGQTVRVLVPTGGSEMSIASLTRSLAEAAISWKEFEAMAETC